MINPAKTTRFNPMEVIISYRSWYTLVDRWICPTIQNGIARFWLIQIVVNFINLFIPRKARTVTCGKRLFPHFHVAWVGPKGKYELAK